MLKNTFIALTLILSLSSVACSTTATTTVTTGHTAQASLEEEMKMLARSFKAFNQATATDQALFALKDMQTAIEESKQIIPTKAKSNVQAYQASFDQLSQVIQQAIVLLNAGQLKEAQALAPQMAKIRDVAHQQYR